MRKLFHTAAVLSVLLIATSIAANAADVRPRPAPYAPPAPAYAPPPFSWTGFYLGGCRPSAVVGQNELIA
jgi:hypothetical protein